ncbi:hypothetical protein [Pedobacter sp. P26]|uniref:hypothetical protein n=1 Tax=Pedobacter sp. P26 TaxID=3423956 RepID=UPI003D6693D0
MTSNLAKTTNKIDGQQSGLRNIKARLEHAYPKNYEFNYGLNENHFQAQLKITYI